MAHQVETMAYANEVPWHGLGARVDQSVTPDEMLKAAGLDWEVNLWPLTASEPEGEESIKVPGRYALVRSTDRKVLTVTGKSWKPLQNRETLEFMRNYVEAGAATLETAGALRGGRVVWGLARLNHEFEVGKGDRVKGYLLITSPHEVGKAITVRATTVRVVCANTMALANRTGTVHYRQAHTSAFDVDAAKEAIGDAHEQLAIAEKNAKILSKLQLSLDDAIEKVLAPVFVPQALKDDDLMASLKVPESMPKTLQEIIDSIESAPGAAEIAGTGWGVLNGVAHWADHVHGRGQASRMYNSWMGQNAVRKLDVERKLLELAE
jgi:phage/plasmid-like protein (TIGR03299 family)